MGGESSCSVVGSGRFLEKEVFIEKAAVQFRRIVTISLQGSAGRAGGCCTAGAWNGGSCRGAPRPRKRMRISNTAW